MGRLVFIACLLSGCDVVWRLDDFRPDAQSSDDGGADASETGMDAAPGCLQDTFTGTAIGAHWEAVREDVAFSVEQAGMLVIDIPANLPGQAEAGVRTVRDYDMTDGFVQVEAVAVVSGSTYNVESYLSASVDAQNRYIIRVSNKTLSCWVVTGGAIVQSANTTYNATNHRYWRIENGPTPSDVRFVTSANGTTWFEHAKVTAEHSFGRLELGLIAGSLQNGDSNPGIAVFDNFMLCPAIAL